MIYTHVSNRDLEQITDPLDSAISKYVEKGNRNNNDKNVSLSSKKSCKPVYLFCYNKL